MPSDNIPNNNTIKLFPEEKISTIRIIPFIPTEALPKILLEKDIFNIIQSKMTIEEEIKDIININHNIQDLYVENVKKALNKRIYGKKKLNIEIKEKARNMIGRKKNSDVSIREHNKFSPDNIINKIKNILKRNLINFANNVINLIYNETKRKHILNTLNIPNNKLSLLIKDIDYKSISQKKAKKDNLFLLKLTIKQFLSQNISSRYFSHKSDYEELQQINKLIINGLLEDKDNKDIFDFIFNKLNVGNFLDIFICQKELSDFNDFNLLQENDKNIIKNSLIRIDSLFNEIKDEANYFFCFILLIYNFKRYYLIKKSRNKSKNY